MGIVGHSALLGTGLMASAGLWLLGQNDPTIPDALKTLGPPTVGLTASAWFLRWFMLVHIPEQQRLHKEQMADLAAANERALKEMATAQTTLVTAFQSEQKETRVQVKELGEQYEKNLNRVVGIFQSQQPADASRPRNT